MGVTAYQVKRLKAEGKTNGPGKRNEVETPKAHAVPSAFQLRSLAYSLICPGKASFRLSTLMMAKVVA
jgi:hypothetical protein